MAISLFRVREKREARALRVHALDDPLAAGHLVRAHHHLTAGIADPLRAGVDALDGEVEGPERDRDVVGLLHHAAELLAVMAPQAVDAHLAHVELADRLPAELRRVEIER